MYLTNDEARKVLQDRMAEEERSAAWIAKRIDKSYQWVKRRVDGVTRMFMDDFALIMSVFDRDK